MSVYEDLKWRGLVHEATEGAEALLDGPPARIYIGFDPSGKSLHVGSLLPLTVLARLQRAGHHPIALVGGGTGMIGDPSGKSAERNLLTSELVEENVRGLRAQIGRCLAFDGVDNPATLVNNGDWLTSFRLIDFLRDVGKCFTVNYMLAKDSVKRRIQSEQGISFTEFTYLVLQSYDFLHLHDHFGVSCQMGATDQWGNITAGCDLIRSQRGVRAQGLVHPLITKADGTKFGKTESGAVWLDAEMTSPFRFYQFWVNTPDKDVIQYLKYFTFLERTEIEALEAAHTDAPHRREAHKRLASELTLWVHGADGLARAERATQVFFGGALEDLPVADVEDVFADVPSMEVSAGLFDAEGGLPLIDLLALDQKILKSKGEAKRSLGGGGVYLNNQKVEDAERGLTRADLIEGVLLVIRIGKRNYHVVRAGSGA